MAYIHYNPNPKHKRCGDCTVRAISKLFGVDWSAAYAALVAKGFEEKDMPSADNVWGALLRDHGFRREIVPTDCPTCYTVRDFAADHPRGAFLLAIKGHVVTLIDGDWYDSFDSAEECPVYFWRRNDQ